MSIRGLIQFPGSVTFGSWIITIIIFICVCVYMCAHSSPYRFPFLPLNRKYMTPTNLDGFILGLMQNTCENDGERYELSGAIRNQSAVTARLKSAWADLVKTCLWKCNKTSEALVLTSLSATCAHVVRLVSFACAVAWKPRTLPHVFPCNTPTRFATLWWLTGISAHQDGRWNLCACTDFAVVWGFSELSVAFLLWFFWLLSLFFFPWASSSCLPCLFKHCSCSSLCLVVWCQWMVPPCSGPAQGSGSGFLPL